MFLVWSLISTSLAFVELWEVIKCNFVYYIVCICLYCFWGFSSNFMCVVFNSVVCSKNSTFEVEWTKWWGYFFVYYYCGMLVRCIFCFGESLGCIECFCFVCTGVSFILSICVGLYTFCFTMYSVMFSSWVCLWLCV